MDTSIMFSVVARGIGTTRTNGSDADIMAATDSMTVQAGDQLGFTVASDLGHPGRQAVYMSKAPSAASEYAGDGDWFKIYELTYSDMTAEGI